MRVAIIDDGINEGYYPCIKLFENVEVSSNLEIIKRNEYDKHNRSHGTICAAIVCKYAKSVEIVGIRILNSMSKNGNIRQLATAFKYCYMNNIRVINISLGTTEYRDFYTIVSLIKLLVNNGTIIIAAINNENRYSLPACMCGVIGVASINRANTKHTRQCIYAPGVHRLQNYKGEIENTKECNSYAAAYVTSKACNMLRENNFMDFFGIVRLLSRPDIINHMKETEYYYKEYMKITENSLILTDKVLSDLTDCKFTGLKIISFNDDILKIILDKNNVYNVIVLLQNSNKEEILYEFININSKSIFSLTLSGILYSKHLISLSRKEGFLLWEEKSQKEYLRRAIVENRDIIQKTEIKCPLITFKNINIDSNKDLYNLKEIFIKEGYNIFTVTSYPKGFLYGHYYLDKAQCNKETFTYLYLEYSCDIMIVLLENNTESKLEFDLVVDRDEFAGVIDIHKKIINFFM